MSQQHSPSPPQHSPFDWNGTRIPNPTPVSYPSYWPVSNQPDVSTVVSRTNPETSAANTLREMLGPAARRNSDSPTYLRLSPDKAPIPSITEALMAASVTGEGLNPSPSMGSRLPVAVLEPSPERVPHLWQPSMFQLYSSTPSSLSPKRCITNEPPIKPGDLHRYRQVRHRDNTRLTPGSPTSP
jgi:hypothetical protein